ncbi:phage scaffolding protein [Paenibacillus sp. SYP-B4298]|uniref:phage scaffolding protein n=1 Tax=Paenibacillus sp. SYP-B4298 TaxID=2996034 RepID=UPI0022DDCE22|nr:phage scaffolding protein [Paenibacillus sp. SYP-B4298]
MNKEQFVELGLPEDLAEKAAAASGEELKGFIPKARFDEVNNAKKAAEKDVADRDAQLEELKKSSGDAEALKQQIEKLQGENKSAKEKYEAQLKDLQITTAIEKALAAANAKHADLLIGKINKEKIELLQDGSVKGLEDQIKPLKESYAELFATEEEGGTKFKGAKPPEGSGGGGTGGAGAVNPWKKETFNLTEQGRLLRDNPDLAKQFKAAAGIK